MSKKTVQIVAHLICIPEKVNELKLLLVSLTEPSRRDEGCIQYKVLQNIENSNLFTLIEEWENQAFFEQHTASELIRTASKKISSLLAEKPNVSFYKLLK